MFGHWNGMKPMKDQATQFLQLGSCCHKGGTNQEKQQPHHLNWAWWHGTVADNIPDQNINTIKPLKLQSQDKAWWLMKTDKQINSTCCCQQQPENEIVIKQRCAQQQLLIDIDTNVTPTSWGSEKKGEVYQASNCILKTVCYLIEKIVVMKGGTTMVAYAHILQSCRTWAYSIWCGLKLLLK